MSLFAFNGVEIEPKFPLAVKNGTASDPSLGLSSEKTGFYKISSGTLGLSVKGVSAFQFSGDAGFNQIMGAKNGFGGGIINRASSLTVPSLLPSRIFSSSGLAMGFNTGEGGGKALAIVVEGSSHIQFHDTGSTLLTSTAGFLNLNKVTDVQEALITKKDADIFYNSTKNIFGLSSGGTVYEVGVSLKTGYGGEVTPAWSFKGNTNTGIARYENNGLGITCGGAYAARFDDNGVAGETRFLLYDDSTGTTKRVLFGADDSGSVVGRKVMEVLN